MQAIKPISNFVSIDEQKQALYYEFMNKKIVVTSSFNDDIDDKQNVYLSITNKLNIISTAFEISKDYTLKTFKNYSDNIIDVFERQLKRDLIMFYSSIPTNKRTLVYDTILQSMYPYVTYHEPTVFKPIKLRTAKIDKIVIRNKRDNKLYQLAKKMSIALCHRDYYTDYLYKIYTSYNPTSKNSKPINITEWEIIDVSFTEYCNLLSGLLEYDVLMEKMWTEYDRVTATKNSINALECVVKFKEVQKQLKEYEQELHDSNLRLEIHNKINNEDYDNIGVVKTHKSERHIKKIVDKSDYQKKLQVSLTGLIAFCKETMKVKEYKMRNNLDYILLSKQLQSDRLSYQTALKQCTNQRRKFMKYRIGNKFAVWKHNNHYGAIAWYKLKDSTVIKWVDKVTFDYETKELKLL